MCNLKKSKSIKTLGESLATVTGDGILLKSLIATGKTFQEEIGVLEDNCSTDNYITHSKAHELNLKGQDIVLEIEGINTTKHIESRIYLVPIRDKKRNLHHIECYGLEKISSDQIDLSQDKSYMDLCRKFGVSPEEVCRPLKIDLLLSSRSNYLMSDSVIKNIDGVKLYSGPLGKTFGGSLKGSDTQEYNRSYPS